MRSYDYSFGNPWQTIDYVYDSGVNGWGRLYSATVQTRLGDSVGQSFTYTPAGLVASKTQQNNGSTTANYTYDNEGRTFPRSTPTAALPSPTPTIPWAAPSSSPTIKPLRWTG